MPLGIASRVPISHELIRQAPFGEHPQLKLEISTVSFHPLEQ